MQLFPTLTSAKASTLALLVRAGPDGFERRLSRGQLVTASFAYHAMLRANGVEQGDRVGVFTQAGAGAPIALVAHAMLGVVSVPLNPKLGPRELRHSVEDALLRREKARTDRPAILVAEDAEWARRQVEASGFLEGEVRVLGLGELIAGLERDGGGDASRAPNVRESGSSASAPMGHGAHASRGSSFAPVDLDGDAELLVLYTSGTTGLPKGVSLTASNIAASLDALAAAWAWSDRDVVTHALPLFHVHGLVLGLFGALRTGGGLAWLPRFEPEALAALLHEHGTMLFAVPTMIHRLLDVAETSASARSSLRNARLVVSGSAGLPVREHQRARALLGRSIVERYGLTETLIDCAVRHDETMAGFVGRPLPGVELRLVDDTRRPIVTVSPSAAEPSTVTGDDSVMGEVAVRGPNVFRGYLNRPEATREVLDSEGWFYTGDMAVARSDGAIRIVGRRATDLIKTGGFKVGAGEVESALLEDGRVAEAAVIGVPDEDLGERIIAFVVRSDPADDTAPSTVARELADSVSAALAPHKRPREVRFVSALPRNAMGKLDKRVLRTMLGPNEPAP